jgi:hypothetical protein
LPPTFKLPPNIIQLNPKDKILIQKAAACLREAFLGSTFTAGAPIMTETYYGKQSVDQPLDESTATDVGLGVFNNWLMNFTLHRNLPFGGVFVYVEDAIKQKGRRSSKNMVVSSVAVSIPPNSLGWDVYKDYEPSVWGLSCCPWNCSSVGLPPPTVLCDCCYGSAERLRAIDKADVEMRHRVTADKKYWYLHALGTTPRLQKKGKASELVRVLSHLADLENVPMYVESGSHLNSLFYLKRGFIKKETIHAYPFSTSRALLRLPNNCSSSVQSADISIGNAKDTI